MPSPAYWSSVLEEVQNQESMNSWRRHMRSIYQRLIAGWLIGKGSGMSLKTDLFEEAVCDYGLLESMGPGAVGLDHSISVARSVWNRMDSPMVLTCDLRRLPFLSGAFQRILSGSSLDHFTNERDIDLALRELARVLAPGGVLVITMDNPSNPAVWLRNHLPFKLMKWCGLVPYFVGPTCSARDATQKLIETGLEVTDCSAVLHVPRAPAIWIVQLLHRLGTAKWSSWFEKLMMEWERFQDRPFKFQTGYYIALRAVKRGEAQ